MGIDWPDSWLGAKVAWGAIVRVFRHQLRYLRVSWPRQYKRSPLARSLPKHGGESFIVPRHLLSFLSQEMMSSTSHAGHPANLMHRPDPVLLQYSCMATGVLYSY